MVIIYYRTRPSEPEASRLALDTQRQRVIRWLEQAGEAVFAEFYEREGRGCRWRAYKAAVALGLSHRMPIVLAGHEPIGSGKWFREFNPNPRTYLTGLIALNSGCTPDPVISAVEWSLVEPVEMIG